MKKIPTKEEKQQEIFNTFYEEMQKCKNIDCLKNLFLEIHKNKNSISAEHLEILSSLKDDMKASLEEKEKPKEDNKRLKNEIKNEIKLEIYENIIKNQK